MGCTRLWREARRLISRNPTKSPLLKLFCPCLNSHKGCSGLPLWNTSLTAGQSVNVGPLPEQKDDLPLWKPYMLSCRTKEDMLVCLKYCLSKLRISQRGSFHNLEGGRHTQEPLRTRYLEP